MQGSGNANIKETSVVRDQHVYTCKSIWTPVIGEELNLKCEESNEHDEYAVAVRKKMVQLLNMYLVRSLTFRRKIYAALY